MFRLFLKSKYFKRRDFKPGVTAAIPTCGRTEKLRKCVESILQDGVIDHVLIWNSAPACVDEVHSLAESLPPPLVSVIEARQLTGCSEAYFELANRIETEFVLFSDDDNYADPGAISELVRLIGLHPEVDILYGAIRRDGKYLDVSQRLNFGFQDGIKTVHKSFHHPEDLDRLGLDMIASDIPNSQAIMRTAIFQRVNFDPKYSWFFERYDFGMQCAREGVRVFGTHRATFEDDPGGYTMETKRGKNREIDRQRFMAKWGVRQVGPTGGGYREWIQGVGQ